MPKTTPATCPRCGYATTPLRPGVRACLNCGHEHATAPPPSPRGIQRLFRHIARLPDNFRIYRLPHVSRQNP